MKIFDKIILGLFGMVAGVGVASAAVPASVSTALTDSATDVTTVAGLALIAVLAAVAFKYMRRAL